MRFLSLDRPLAVFDVEATGLNPRTDRIIELSAIRLEPRGARTSRTWLLNPTVPIPLETIAVHGITDEMVAGQPTFADKAAEILEFFRGCDLGGFGLLKLDVPILEEEFERCGLHFHAPGRRQFDAMRIYHRREPRDLAAALRFYCGEELDGAHGAEADAAATLRVLEGQFARYPDLTTDPEALDRELNERDPFSLDRDGRFRWLDGEVTVNFGRKKGQRLRELAEKDPSFLRWIQRGDFARDTKKIVTDALAGRFPDPPSVTPTSGHVNLFPSPGPETAAAPNAQPPVRP